MRRTASFAVLAVAAAAMSAAPSSRADTPGAHPTNLFRQLYTGTRNNVTSDVGFQFTPNQQLVVSALGRGVSQLMQREHTVTLWRVSDQAELGQVTVSPFSPIDTSGYRHQDLPSPVTLNAGVAYRLVSSETNGGDKWADVTAMPNHDPVTSIDFPVDGSSGTYPATAQGSTADTAYGPPTLFFASSEQYNLARALPSVDAVSTSSSEQGPNVYDTIYGDTTYYPYPGPHSPWNRVSLTNGSRTSTATDLGWQSMSRLDRDHTEWAQVDLGNLNPVDRVDLWPRTDTGNIGEHFPVDFTIATSSDGSTWTAVSQQTSYPKPTTATAQSFTFPAQQARYVRVTMTRLRTSPTDGGTVYRAQLKQLEVYNDASPQTPPAAAAAPVARHVSVGDLIDGTGIHAALSGTGVMSGWTLDQTGGTIAQADAQGSYLNITKAAVAQPVQLARQFPPTSTPVTMEFRFNLSQVMDGISWQLRSGNTPVFELRTAAGQLVSVGPGGALTPLAPYAASTEYGVRVTVDLSAGAARISLNGKTLASAAALESTATALDNLRLIVGGSGGVLTHSGIHVFTGYAVYDHFRTAIGSVAPDDWTVNAPGGTVAPVDTQSSFHKPDTWVLGLARTSLISPVTVSRAFPAQTGDPQTHLVRVAARLLLPTATDKASEHLRVGTSGLLDIGFAGGQVTAGGTPVTTFVPNVWYDVQADLNLQAATAQVTLDGRAPVTVPLPAGSTQLDTAAWSLDAPGNAQLADVEVYPIAPEPADYAPAPQPVPHGNYLIGVQSCNMWREGDSGPGYDFNRNDADRKPLIGWYEEGSAESTDWQISQLVDHAVDFEQMCWFGSATTWNTTTAPIRDTAFTGDAIERGLNQARYGSSLKFTIDWIQSPITQPGVQDNGPSPTTKVANFENYVFPYWMEHYFKNPRYLLVDNKPVVSIFSLEGLQSDFGAQAATVVSWMRQQCIAAGFSGLILFGGYTEVNAGKGQPGTVWVSPNVTQMTTLKTLGFDAAFSYAYNTTALEQKRSQDAATAGLSLIGGPSVNWAHEAWTTAGSTEGYFRDPTVWQQQLQTSKDTFMPQQTGLGSRMLLFDNWNEFGEGHFITPTVGLGFGYLDAIRAVFAPGSGLAGDEIPSPAAQARMDTLYPNGGWGDVYRSYPNGSG